MKNIDTALILAAGYGSRLKHFTIDLPKPLVEFKGKPMIENVINKLESYGIKNIFINTHHHYQKMEEYFAHRKSSSKIQLLYEKEILGTGGAIKNAEKNLYGINDFLIYNTDVDCEIDLNDFEDAHFSKNALATLAVNKRKTSRYLLTSLKGALLGRTENDINVYYSNFIPNSENIVLKAFCGIHILNNKIFKFFPANDDFFDIIPLYMSIIKRGLEIFTYDISETYWKDLGIPDNL